jgi:hypothetical protein
MFFIACDYLSRAQGRCIQNKSQGFARICHPTDKKKRTIVLKTQS